MSVDKTRHQELPLLQLHELKVTYVDEPMPREHLLELVRRHVLFDPVDRPCLAGHTERCLWISTIRAQRDRGDQGAVEYCRHACSVSVFGVEKTDKGKKWEMEVIERNR
jgi:hypothetical protein